MTKKRQFTQSGFTKKRTLEQEYLGSDHVNHLANKMEACLASRTYHGEQKNWDWSRYTNAHIKQHTIAK
jgi:hypothetical protein